MWQGETFSSTGAGNRSPHTGCRVVDSASFRRPGACISAPGWQKTHPGCFSDTCQRVIFIPSRWERQEPGSNPQLKRLEQNNSAGIRERERVFALSVFTLSVCTQTVKSLFQRGCVFLFLWASGTCCSVTAPETSCMRAANIKRFAGRAAVGRIAGKQRTPGLSLWGCRGKWIVNKIMSGAKTRSSKIFEIQERAETFPRYEFH